MKKEKESEELAPLPLKKRICSCGCGHEFQPGRRNQKYYNSIHANFGYNHNQRKKRDKNKNELFKVISKNDRILEKHYESRIRGEKALVAFTVIRSEGFDNTVFTGREKIDEELYFTFYNYAYRIYEMDGYKLVEIKKIK